MEGEIKEVVKVEGEMKEVVKVEGEEGEVLGVKLPSAGERGPAAVPPEVRETTNVPASEDTPAATVSELPPVGRRRRGSIWRRTAAGPGSLSLRKCAEESVTEMLHAARYLNIMARLQTRDELSNHLNLS